MKTIVGRNAEIALMNEYVSSDRAEFVAVFGRRRVGKTFLVDSLFHDVYAFSVTGVVDGESEVQMQAFVDALEMYGYALEQKPVDWFDAFVCLRKFLISRIKPNEKCIVFIDELPSLDVKGYKLVQALGYFWNSWASKQDNLTLIVCGSSTSWMIRNIIDNKGGLHDRITHEIHLHPFSLKETEEYLLSIGCQWDRLSVVQAYMIFGGIPYYLSLLRSDLSLSQNVDKLFFSRGAELRREFHRLFATLFRQPDTYISIIRLLASHKSGLTREEIVSHLGNADNGHISDKLEDLVNCDFIRRYNVKKKKISSKSGIYQLMDFFTLFYLSFAEKETVDEHFWTNHLNMPEVNSWLGLAYERVCMAHVAQIKHRLHIDSISTEYYSWRSLPNEGRTQAQIDLIIERADRVINLCEIKYSDSEYSLQKDEYLRFMNRLSVFREETGTRFAVWPTFITTYGLLQGSYASSVPVQLTADDLFEF